MKKWWSALFLVLTLLMNMGLVYAQPEPVRQVEMNRKPGIDFRQFKSLGNEISVSLQPTTFWAIDKSDPFLKQRIRDLALKGAKNQGWVLADNVDADVKLSVKILEWGRYRNTQDQNLMEFLKFELRVDSPVAGGMVFRGAGQYSRVDPTEPDLVSVAEAYSSIIEEFLAELHVN